MFLSEVSIKRPVFATMMMVALATLGIFSYRRLNIDLWPDIDFPVVVVQTVYPGASPEAVEREVTRRIEEVVNPIEGVREVTSTSLEGLSTVVAMFELDVNSLDAQQDVRTKIESIRAELPEDIEVPLVLRFDPGEIPIVSLALRSEKQSRRELTTLAEETLKKRLEAVNGVGQVSIVGGEQRAVVIELDPDRLAASQVSVAEVMAAAGSENREVPAGRLEWGPGERLVRLEGRLESPEDFAAIAVAQRGGRVVHLGEVATPRDGAEEVRSAAFVGADPAVALEVRKVSGANTVEVAETIKEALPELRALLPEGAELGIVRDNSVWIRDSVEDVQTTIVIGALLTVLVVFLFLNSWRSTVITGLTLPVSLISAFLAIYAFGFTINIMTLMALSLATGILIDDAIVVRENIVRHVQRGEDHHTAAIKGTSEIGLAVMATTFTIVAVFVPVAFMGGIVGKFFYEFGITVTFAVLVSLFVSFTLDPMLSSVWYDPVAAGVAEHGRFGRAIERFNEGFVGLGHRYRRVIGWALGHRYATLGIAAASFIGALALFPFIGGDFMPKSDESEFAVVVKTPVGSSLAYTQERVREVAVLVERHLEVDYTYSAVGGGWEGQVNEAEMYVKLVPKRKRELSQFELEDVLRRELGALPGLRVSILTSGGFGGAEKPVQVYVSGPQLDELRRISDELLVKMRATPGLIEVESGLEADRPELRVDLRRDLASDLGLGVTAVAQTLRPALAGQEVGNWEDPDGEQHPVIVRLPDAARTSTAALARLPLLTGKIDPRTGAPQLITLGHIAQLAESSGPQKIERRNLERLVALEANYYGRTLTEVSGDIERAAEAIDMPPGYRMVLGGESEHFGETVHYIIESLILAVVFIYLILASQFGAFLQPLAIMLSLPLSLVGVFLGLLATGSTFNMMSMIGLILLMGLVTKNAILLVDFANQARARGSDRRRALIDAGETRLRPIVMTTLAMIFGMMPIALALGAGAEFRAPMARAVIGGLIASTLLTLVVVPVVYTFLDDAGGWVKRRLTRERHEAEEKAREEEEAEGRGRVVAARVAVEPEAAGLAPGPAVEA